MVPLGLSAILIVKPGIGADTLNTIVLYTKLNSNLPYTLIRVGYTKYETEINKIIECMKVQQPTNNTESVQEIRTLMDTLITDKNCYINYPKSQSKNTDEELLAKFNHLLESKKLNDSLNTKINNTINLLTCVYNMSSTSNDSSTENAPNVSRFIRYVFEYILDCKNLYDSNSKDENILNEFVSNMVTKIGENFPELKDSSDNEFYRFALSTVHIDFVEITQIMYNQLYLYYLSNNSSITNLNTTIHQAAARLDRYQKSISNKISELSQGYDKSNAKANWVRAYHKYMEGVMRVKIMVVALAKNTQYVLYNLTDNVDEEISKIIDELKNMFNRADIYKQIVKLEKLLTDVYTKSRTDIKLGGGPQSNTKVIEDLGKIEKDLKYIRKLAKMLSDHDANISDKFIKIMELLNNAAVANFYYGSDNVKSIIKLSNDVLNDLQRIYSDEFLPDEINNIIEDAKKKVKKIEDKGLNKQLVNDLRADFEKCIEGINKVYIDSYEQLLHLANELGDVNREKILKSIEGLRFESLFNEADETKQEELIDKITEFLPKDKKNLGRELSNTYLGMKESYLKALTLKLPRDFNVKALKKTFTEHISHNKDINKKYDDLLKTTGKVNRALESSLVVLRKMQTSSDIYTISEYNTILSGIYDTILKYLQTGSEFDPDHINELINNIEIDKYAPEITDLEDRNSMLLKANEKLEADIIKIKYELDNNKKALDKEAELLELKESTRKDTIGIQQTINRLRRENNTLVDNNKKAINNMSIKLRKAKAQMNQLKKDHAAVIYKLKQDHKKQLEQQNQVSKKELEDALEAKIKELNDQYKKDLEKTSADYQSNLLDNNIQKNEEMESALSQLRTQKDIETQDALTRLSEEKDAAIDKLKKDHQNQLEQQDRASEKQLKDALEAKIKELNDQFNIDLKATMEVCKSNLLDNNTQKHKEMESALSQLRTQKDIETQDALTRLSEEKDAAIDKLKKDHQNQLEQQDRASEKQLKDALEAKIKELNDQFNIDLKATMEVCKSNLLDNNTQKHKEMESALSQLRTQKDTELKELSTQKEKISTEMKDIKDRLRQIFDTQYVDAILNPKISIVDAKIKLGIAYALKDKSDTDKQSEISRLINENTKLKYDIDRTRTANNHIRKNIKNIKSKSILSEEEKIKLAELTQKDIEAQEKIKKLIKASEVTNETIKQLNQQNIMSLTKNTTLESDIQQLAIKNSKLQNDLDDKQTKVSTLTDEINKIKNSGMYSDEDVKELIKLYTNLPHNILYHENVRRVMRMYMHKHPL
jgi:hypothetical protein